MNEKAGILLLNKPRGKTSFSLVHALRKITGVQKIGHAGTLDPFATGVMVMLIGREYTRLSDQFLHHDKEYVARLRLGITTDTYDCEGQILSTSDHIPETIHLPQGTISQIPPMYSAKKVNGKRLYKLAREGKTIERKPSWVTVQIDLLSYNYPYLDIHVVCSKGTYIRSLAHDIGLAHDCGAHLTYLERIRSGPFHIDDCLKSIPNDITPYLKRVHVHPDRPLGRHAGDADVGVKKEADDRDEYVLKRNTSYILTTHGHHSRDCPSTSH